MIGRRGFLFGAGALATAGGAYAWLQRPLVPAQLPVALRPERLWADVVHYARMGAHLTASPADEATGTWQAEHLAAHGFAVRRHAFHLRQYFPISSSLRTSEGDIPVLPQWPVLGSLDVEAPLVPLENQRGMRDAVAFLTFPYNARASVDLPEYRALLTKAAAAGARAALALTEGPSGEIVIMNARPDRPLPLPVGLIASHNQSRLAAVAYRGEKVRLTFQGEVLATQASSIVGLIDRGTPWVVISTPQSGWTPAAGERGVGIALWRALAAALPAASRASLLLVSNSGHELGHLGARAMLPLVGRIVRSNGLRLWLHLGANIATRAYTAEGDRYRLRDEPSRRRYLVGTPSILAGLAWSFADQPGMTPLPAINDRMAGEIDTILDHGFSPVVGIFGAGLFHHTMQDLPEQATSPALVGNVGQAVWRLASSKAS